MRVVLNDDQIRHMLEAIVSAENDDARIQAGDRLLLTLHESGVIDVWGNSLTRHFVRPDAEETIQVVTESLVELARNITAEEVAVIDVPARYLYYQAKRAVRTWIDSPAVTLASKMAGVSRRFRAAKMAQYELRKKTGEEPTPAEVVKYANEKAHATRKNPMKQGALLTVEDVEGTKLRPYSSDFERDNGRGAKEIPADDTMETQVEASFTIHQLGKLAIETYGRDEGAHVRSFLNTWSEMILDGETPTVASLQRTHDVPRRVAKERLEQVEKLLEVFRDDG